MSNKLSCKLTTPELQLRKKTVIAELKTRIRERSDSQNAIKLRFEGSDRMIDLLTSFIKTERLCCDFVDFTLTIKDENNSIWLALSGPEGTKNFLQSKLGL